MKDIFALNENALLKESHNSNKYVIKGVCCSSVPSLCKNTNTVFITDNSKGIRIDNK
jgi:hypothetical protein